MHLIEHNNRILHYLGDIIKSKSKVENDWLTVEDLDKNHSMPDYNSYEKMFINLLEKFNHKNKKFKFSRGDISVPVDEFTIVKNRAINLTSGVILRSIEFSRHWGDYLNRPNDLPFDKKKNKIFWRGASTGEPCMEGNRFELVTKWFEKNKNIDVGLAFTCQNKNDYDQYIKGLCNISDFLENKYLLSIRGNDKDSGLNWKLNSNSLVLMPKPRVYSWLMENLLKPNIHYVEIRDDFSDIEEKLNWCNENQEICKNIVFNANKFMEVFKDQEIEERIEKEVIDKYFKIIENL